jgi:putative ATP-binding cassette transporter
MNLLRFFFRYSRRTMIWTSLAALLSGVCNAGLIAMVNTALNGTDTRAPLLVGLFVALGLCRLATNFWAQAALTRFSQKTTADLRRDLVRKILDVPLRHLENIGAPRLMVALTEDVMNITQAMLAVPCVMVNVAILLGGAVYLGWLSPGVLGAVGVFILVGAASYRLLIKNGFRYLVAARDEEDRLFGYFRALTEGIKELKLHRERRGVFLSRNIESTTAAYQRHNVKAEMHFILAQNWSHFLFFTLVGLILFFLPRIENVSPQALTGYIITMLYLMGPLAGVLGTLSLFGRAGVSLQKIEDLGLALSSQSADACPLVSKGPLPEFRKLELVGVTHTYRREKEDDHFTIGPIHLAFHPGELVFLVGGNGSGKSTLAKVLAGLYPPQSGEIRLNGELVASHNSDDYRQNFSAVFSDFYLFDNLLGVRGPRADAHARDYLGRLHLEHKVKICNGRLSTTSLSQGQRKRLALLAAYLEDRPFYLFDEWASDQDPLFKEVFYTQLLPELRARNKAVLVITHDDHYFHLADRLIKLDYGKIEPEKPLPEPETARVARNGETHPLRPVRLRN